MDFNNDKINQTKSLEDLKQKLSDLDILMHRNAMNGTLKELDKSLVEKYSRSNPFTKNNNTFSN